jgi:hypothetical protein
MIKSDTSIVVGEKAALGEKTCATKIGAKSACIKNLIAVLIAFAGFGLAVMLMIKGEMLAFTPLGKLITPGARQTVLTGLMAYFQGIGGAMVLSAIAYIMVGQEDIICTTVPDPKKR